MSLSKKTYNSFKEGRPRTKNIGVEDIPRTGSGRMGRDPNQERDSFVGPTVKKYEVKISTDTGKEKDAELTSSEILKLIKTNPKYENISLEDVKVGEKYEYSRKTPQGADKKGTIILKNKTPIKVLINTDAKRVSYADVNPEGEKSVYQAGSVHEIVFNNTTKGVTRRAYKIYRTITETDYNTLKSGIRNKVQTLITPSTEKDHYKDVYYITIPKVIYSQRKGADYTYFIYLKKEKVNSYTEEQKNKIKLTLVPIADIAKGLDTRPLDFATFSSFLGDEEKKKLRSPKPPSSKEIEDPFDFDLELLFGDDFDLEDDEEPEESPKDKEAKRKASEFMLDDRNERAFTSLIKYYDIYKTPSSKEEEKAEANKKMGETLDRFLNNLFDFSKDPKVTDAVINYSVESKLKQKQGLFKQIKGAYDLKSLQEQTLLEMNIQLSDDVTYNVNIKYQSGSKPQSASIKGKVLKKFLKVDNVESGKEYDFEQTVDDPKRGFQTIKGTVTVMAPPEKDRKLTLIGRRTPEGEPIYGDPSSKSKEKNKKDGTTKTMTVSLPGQGARSVKVPVNKGVKTVDVKPNELRYKYYIVDVKNKKIVKGSDDWEQTKQKASELGPDYKAVPKPAVSKYTGDIYEEFTDKEKGAIESNQISFKIKSDPKDPDVEAQVTGNAKSAVLNKNKELVITLDNNSQAIFKDENTGKYYENPQDKQTFSIINFIGSPLNSVLKKVFTASKPESKLEAYIRQRIKRALQEAELSQYMGAQGPEVKKKRLEEYMKKYEWGFQESEDPYVRSNGTEKHSIVSKLVHELGDEGVSIFNSYAPKGYEIARPDDLNDMADSPLGSQMARPFEPNTLTSRGGRVAEEAKYDSLYNQAKRDVENKYKDVEDLAVGYNKKDREIERSTTLKKNIEKLISQEYGKDASKASPELKKAFMSISDKDLKSSI